MIQEYQPGTETHNPITFTGYMLKKAKVNIRKLDTIIFYLIQDLKRGPLQFKIAVFSVFLTVSFMTILLNVNPILMSMFLTVTEREVGDSDFIITPNFDFGEIQNSPFVNKF